MKVLNFLKSNHEENNELLISNLKRSVLRSNIYFLELGSNFSRSIVSTLFKTMHVLRQDKSFF